jgi:hypothetical protein
MRVLVCPWVFEWWTIHSIGCTRHLLNDDLGPCDHALVKRASALWRKRQMQSQGCPYTSLSLPGNVATVRSHFIDLAFILITLFDGEIRALLLLIGFGVSREPVD